MTNTNNSLVTYESRALATANYDLVDQRLADHENLSGDKLLRLVWIVLGFTIIVIGGWAAFAPLNKGVTANGAIATQSARQVLQSLDGGIVKTLNVKEGARVKAGDIVVELDSGLANAQYQVLRQQYFDHLAERAMLEADMIGGPIQWAPELLQNASDPTVKIGMDTYARLLSNRRAQRSATKAVLGQQVAGLSNQVAGLRSQAGSIASQDALIAEETAGIQELYDQGYAPKSRVLALQRNAASLQGNLGQTQAQIAQATTAMGEKRVQALQLDAADRQESSRRLSEVVSEIPQLSERLIDQRQVLSRTTLRSPVNGVVLTRHVSTIGGVVRPGEPIIEIVPTDQLMVTSNVRPQDVENVNVGMKAKVKLTGLNAQTTPELFGTVTYVSADALADERTGMRYYQIRVSVPNTERAKLKGVAITPGMPADVMVDGGKRTMLEYLLHPVKQAFSHAFRES